MGALRQFKCDACGRDLTTTGNSIDYRLALKNEHVPSVGGFVTDMMVYPAIEHDVHFCGLSCLRAWLDKALALRSSAPANAI